MKREGASPLHIPVCLERTLDLLSPPLSADRAESNSPQPILVDGTLGMGGHSRALLQAAPGARLIGIDRDPEALAEAERVLAPFADRITLVRAGFDQLADVLDELRIGSVSAMLLDLGVSSLQIDSLSRGFAYSRDTPLDMRMDPTSGPTAADLVAQSSQEELTRMLRGYGEERHAARIAAAIVAARSQAPITSTARLADIVADAVPSGPRRRSGHPAKRVFQALRIEVNDELGALRRVLPVALGRLRVGGRLEVLAYHSGEDRMVKRAFAEATTVDVPAGIPLRSEQIRPPFVSLTRGAEKAGPAEVDRNPRSASVRLRAVERIQEAA